MLPRGPHAAARSLALPAGALQGILKEEMDRTGISLGDCGVSGAHAATAALLCPPALPLLHSLLPLCFLCGMGRLLPAWAWRSGRERAPFTFRGCRRPPHLRPAACAGVSACRPGKSAASAGRQPAAGAPAPADAQCGNRRQQQRPTTGGARPTIRLPATQLHDALSVRPRHAVQRPSRRRNVPAGAPSALRSLFRAWRASGPRGTPNPRG